MIAASLRVCDKAGGFGRGKIKINAGEL